MAWIERRIGEERAAQRRRREVRERDIHSAELMKRDMPVLWRGICSQCQDAVDTFNREFQDRRASLRKESVSSFSVELHRPGGSMMTARLAMEGYRIDYSRWRDSEIVEEVPAKIAFHAGEEGVFMSAEGRRVDTDGAVRSLLEAVLFE